MKTVSIDAERGTIYDRNGYALAYNEKSYSVTITDVSSSDNGNKLSANDSILAVSQILHANGDSMTGDFGIAISVYGDYQFTNEGTAQQRFLADIYGYPTIEELTDEQKNKTPTQVVEDLAERYDVDLSAHSFSDSEKKLYTLDIIIARYKRSLNNFQKYVAADIASDISEESVAQINEIVDTLSGIAVEENSVRRYADAKYFSNIIGYVGEISSSQLTSAQEENADTQYASGDIVGKMGLEASMNDTLFGTKGQRSFSVDSLGTEIDSTYEVTDPIAGNNIYLTIDADLQKAAYDILEKYMSQLIIERLTFDKTFTITSSMDDSEIYIPIYDVYAAVFENIANLDHFTADDASETEKSVYQSYQRYIANVHDNIGDYLYYDQSAYNTLSSEYKVYLSYISSHLFSDGVIQYAKVDTDDWVYKTWSERQKISLSEFLLHAIDMEWIDKSKLNLAGNETDRNTIFNALYAYIEKMIDSEGFAGEVYHYMLVNDAIDPRSSCQILLDQGIVSISDDEATMFENGWEDAYSFMYNRIRNLDLTPAQLHLYPYSGSLVMTDVNNGSVLAMVSYPGYDNNRISDPSYYAQLQRDESLPMLNYATSQTTPPGSTFKMVTATAGLMENAITIDSTTYCMSNPFTKIDPAPSCWIYPSGHGELSLQGAIRDSCNIFFYTVGYRLGMKNGTFALSDEDASYWVNAEYSYSDRVDDGYDSEAGAQRLAKYAELYGLGTKSGVEVEEAAPNLPTTDAVRAAIGQSDNSYSTAGLAKYVTAIANSGTVYSLSLIGSIEDSLTGAVTAKEPVIESAFSMNSSYWDTIHAGMRDVVSNTSYYENLPVAVAGKTGTAQAGRAPSHALFVCYAPYSAPQVAAATRITNGYGSAYASQVTEKVLEYYYGTSTLDQIIAEASLDTNANLSEE